MVVELRSRVDWANSFRLRFLLLTGWVMGDSNFQRDLRKHPLIWKTQSQALNANLFYRAWKNPGVRFERAADENLIQSKWSSTVLAGPG